MSCLDRAFIKNFAEVAAPLTEFTKKCERNQVQWEEQQENAIEQLRKPLTNQPI